MQKFTGRAALPEHLPTKKTFFCLLCGASGVHKIRQADDTVVYECHQCNGTAERFLAWDPGMVQYFNNVQELVHGSVGVIVLNQRQEILLFKRVKYPFLWTIPAGHRDLDEDPLLAAVRELEEETGIVGHKLQPIFTGEIRGDSCVGGADIHFWHAYIYRLTNDIVPTIQAEEGVEWGWFNTHQIPAVTVPVTYLLSHPAVQKTLASN